MSPQETPGPDPWHPGSAKQPVMKMPELVSATEEEIAEERRKSDEFVNQPCYDADGVPILPGETVYSIHSGMPHKIIYTHCGIFCFENPMDHYDPRFPEHSKFPIVAARMTHRKPDDCEERA